MIVRHDNLSKTYLDKACKDLYHTNMNKNGLVVLVGGPSGAGKNTVIRKVIEKNPEMFGWIVSYATREPRVGEVDGVDYHFISEAEFHELLKSGDIIEFTDRHGDFKGMGGAIIDKVLSEKSVALKDVDVKGVFALRERGYDVFAIYLTAPRDLIEYRLVVKRGFSPDEAAHRLSDYEAHLSTATHYDVTLDIDDADKCAAKVYKLILDRLGK